MYSFYLNQNQYSIPNTWEELSTEEFIYLGSLFRRYLSREISHHELNTIFILKLLKIKLDGNFVAKAGEQAYENIYMISRYVNFYYYYEYENKKAYKSFSVETQNMLRKSLPEELSPTTEIKAAMRLKKHIRLDTIFAKNAIPTIKIGRKKFEGYQVSITGSIITTSITTKQYADAHQVINQIYEHKKEELLPLLAAILYQKKYSEDTAYKNLEKFKTLSSEVLHAIILNFAAVTNFITQRTKYAILFNRSGSATKQKKTKGTYNLGMHAGIYDLVKKGYGTMEDENLFKFFDIMVKELSDNIQTGINSGLKIPEIAEKLNLTINQVNQLL